MKNANLISRLCDFYKEGFSQMDIGRTLWLVVIIKLMIMFFVIKLFFMPDVLEQKAGDGNEPEYISLRLTGEQ